MKKISQLYYGWWLVLLCLFIGSLSAGTITYCMSLVAGAMGNAFEVSRTTVMLGITGHSLMTGLLAPKLGSLMDRFSIRTVIIATSAFSASGFLLLSLTPSIWGFIGIYSILIPAGSTCMMVLCPPILLSRWFSKYRGTAIGTACLGTQLGGFLLPPLIAFLFTEFGWRISVFAMGALLMLVPIAAWLWLVEKPADKGLSIDGETTPAKDPASDDLPPIEQNPTDMVKAAVMAREFWMSAFGFAMIMGLIILLLGNLALFATDLGISRERSSLLISLFALVGMVCSPLVGRLCDLIDIRLVFAALISVNIASMLLFAAADNFTMLLVASGIVGITGGGFSPLWGAMLGKLYDMHIYARIVGLMNFFILSFSACTPLLSGFLYDLTGSYRTLFLVMAATMAIPLLYSPLFRLRDQVKSENGGKVAAYP